MSPRERVTFSAPSGIRASTLMGFEMSCPDWLNTDTISTAPSANAAGISESTIAKAKIAAMPLNILFFINLYHPSKNL